MKKLLIAACVCSIASFAAAESQAQTQQIRITVTNNSTTEGVAITPLWLGFHDNSFDTFEVGGTATAGLEEIAELGSAGGLDGEFNAVGGRVSTVLGSPDGPPPIQAGESVTSGIFGIDTAENQYLSYASMILPSSDFFVANDNAFDISSIFGTNDSISFNIGQTVWNAGTEVDDFATSPGNPLFGIPGGDGAAGEDENGVISAVTGDPYANFLNRPDGFDFSPFNFNDTNLYPNGVATVTITAVPEPTSLGIIGLGLGGLFLRRRRS